MVEGLRFTMLGPLRAWHGTGEVELGQPMTQAVLVTLLSRRGSRATVPELIEDLWGPHPPASAQVLVRTYVHRLRRALEPTGCAQIIWTAGTYLLQSALGELDTAEFERLLSLARAHAANGDAHQALDLYDGALALWSGPALANIPGPFAQAKRKWLTTRQLAALQEQAACLVDVGRAEEAAAQLAQLVLQEPLQERLRELHMVALYRAGRRADALVAYQDAVQVLREELGVDPAPSLQASHLRILNADPDLAPAEFRMGSPGRIVPAQLPAVLPLFTGRKKALADLTASSDGDGRRAAAVHVIHGMAGVGKTALAVAAAHRLRHDFPDGGLYADLHGFGADTDAAAQPADVLRDFLFAFGVPAVQLPENLEARAALLRSLLDGRRVLIVLDNARDPAQVRPLLLGVEGCLTLVTSRNQLIGLTATDHARALHLGVFDGNEARSYLTDLLGSERVRKEESALQQIIDYCAGLPLALSIAAARAAQHPHAPLATVIPRLYRAKHRLDALTLGRDSASDARVVFSWSYLALQPETARMFRLLALHPGRIVTPTTAAALAAVPHRQAADLLAELADAHLLVEREPGQYAFHDLLHAYASELVDRYDDSHEREQARLRLVSHWELSTEIIDHGGMPTPPCRSMPLPPPRHWAEAATAVPTSSTPHTGLTSTVRYPAL